MPDPSEKPSELICPWRVEANQLRPWGGHGVGWGPHLDENCLKEKCAMWEPDLQCMQAEGAPASEVVDRGRCRRST
jgi:hypothetical protein